MLEIVNGGERTALRHGDIVTVGGTGADVVLLGLPAGVHCRLRGTAEGAIVDPGDTGESISIDGQPLSAARVVTGPARLLIGGCPLAIEGHHDAPAPAAATAPPSRRSPFYLLVVEGDPHGARHPLDRGTLTVGRGSANDLQFDVPGISTEHARLTVEADEVRVEDLGSTNGSAIDGKKLAGRQPLLPGQDLLLGRGFTVRLELATAGALRELVVEESENSGELTGRRIPLHEGLWLFGRALPAAIRLDALGVSGRHARLSVSRTAGGRIAVEVTDVGSSNGTFVDGERIERPTSLARGQQLRFGKLALRLVSPGESIEDSQKRPAMPDARPDAPVVFELLGVSGGCAGQRFQLRQGGQTVGRGPVALSLDEPSISSKHARVEVNGQTVTVVDCESSNGTFVGGSRLAPGAAATLAVDARVRFGNNELALVRPGEMAKAAPSAGGYSLPHEDEADDDVPAQTIVRGAPTLRLIPDAGGPAVELSQGERTVGRAATNDWQLDAAGVSGNHCKLVVRGVVVEVTDLGSRYGTTVDGVKLGEGETARAVNGATIAFGTLGYTLRIESPGGARPRPPSAAHRAARRRRPKSLVPAAAVLVACVVGFVMLGGDDGPGEGSGSGSAEVVRLDDVEQPPGDTLRTISETEVRWMLGRCAYDMLRREVARRPATGPTALPLRETADLHLALFDRLVARLKQARDTREELPLFNSTYTVKRADDEYVELLEGGGQPYDFAWNEMSPADLLHLYLPLGVGGKEPLELLAFAAFHRFDELAEQAMHDAKNGPRAARVDTLLASLGWKPRAKGQMREAIRDDEPERLDEPLLADERFKIAGFADDSGKPLSEGGTLTRVRADGRMVLEWEIGAAEAKIGFEGLPADLRGYRTLRLQLRGGFYEDATLEIALVNVSGARAGLLLPAPDGHWQQLELPVDQLAADDDFDITKVARLEILARDGTAWRLQLARLELDPRLAGTRREALPKSEKMKPVREEAGGDGTKSVIPQRAKASVRPRPLIIEARGKGWRGSLVAVDDKTGIRLRTPEGDKSFRWSELSPYSTWRVKSFAAGRNAQRHQQLGQYCESKGLFQQARWEYAAAKALGAGGHPDLKSLTNKALDAVIPGLHKMQSNARRKAMKKKLAADEKARLARNHARAAAAWKRHKVTAIDTIVDKGDVSRRLDIVIISDGFDAQALTKEFPSMCDALVNRIRQVQPFSNYPSYINFHRVSITEAKKGIDGTTAVGSNVDDANILTCDRGKAVAIARLAPEADLIVVVAYVKQRGVRATGGGGVLTLNAFGGLGATAIHELGHAFGALADEYVDPVMAQRRGMPSREPGGVNVTLESNPLKVKWHYFNAPGPRHAPPQTVGCHEGAMYQPRGVYRPAPGCRMRASASRFCPVCFEAVEKKFYRIVAPIDESNPHRPLIKQFKGARPTLLAKAVVAEGRAAGLGKLRAIWAIDGKRTKNFNAKNRSTWWKGESFDPGDHEVALRVDFLNRRVRRDDGVLSGARVWRLRTFDAETPKIELRVDTRTQEMRGSLRRNSPEVLAKAKLQPVIAEMPPGATLLPGTLGVGLTPVHTGRYGVRAAVVDEEGEAVHVDDRVRSVTPGGKPPVLPLPRYLEAREGDQWYYRLPGIDPDGDLLQYEVEGLPDGAVLNRYTGEIYWPIGYRQSGKYPLEVVCTDGNIERKRTTTLLVADRPVGWGTTLRGADLLLALRSPRAGLVHAKMGALPAEPVSFQVLELARLMRHRDTRVADTARQRLETLLVDPGKNQDLFYLFLLDQRVHVWHFGDRPKMLDFFDKLAKDVDAAGRAARMSQTLRGAGRTIAREVAAVRQYNRSRGVGR